MWCLSCWKGCAAPHLYSRMPMCMWLCICCCNHCSSSQALHDIIRNRPHLKVLSPKNCRCLSSPKLRTTLIFLQRKRVREMENSAIKEIRKQQAPLPSPFLLFTHLSSHPSSLQQRTDFSIPVAAFSRLVFEIHQDFNTTPNYAPDALLALQSAAEDYIVEVFQVRASECWTCCRDSR
jgi:histone H3/H4